MLMVGSLTHGITCTRMLSGSPGSGSSMNTPGSSWNDTRLVMPGSSLTPYGLDSSLGNLPSALTACSSPMITGWSREPRRVAIDTTTRSGLDHQKSCTTEFSRPMILAVGAMSARRTMASTVRSSIGAVIAM